MIPLGWGEVEALGLGELAGGRRTASSGASTTTRATRGPATSSSRSTPAPGSSSDALERGAATLVPDDQEAALATLAGLVRGALRRAVVAVVGSTGKTTTKDALGALCAAVTPTVAAEASRNNELGLPLTVLRLEPETRVLVTEMGMRGLGQIAELCRVARPTVALVTSIGPEHLELVGSVEDVARANAEALDALPAGGIAVVPADEPLLEPYLRPALDVRRFDRATVRRENGAWRFEVGGTELVLELPFDQRHLAENVLAALTAYDALGLPLERAEEGARSIALSRWRGEVRELPGGGFVVNDAYNANPTSMRAALRRPRRARGRPAPRRDPRRDGGARRRERALPRRDRRPRSASSGSSSSSASASPPAPTSRTRTASSSRTRRRSTGSRRACVRATRSSSRPRGRWGSKASPP